MRSILTLRKLRGGYVPPPPGPPADVSHPNPLKLYTATHRPINYEVYPKETNSSQPQDMGKSNEIHKRHTAWWPQGRAASRDSPVPVSGKPKLQGSLPFLQKWKNRDKGKW